jgi:hypothetical protein
MDAPTSHPERVEAVVVYHGDRRCSTMKKKDGFACTSGAYFRLPSGALVCGLHARGKGAEALPKHSAAELREKSIALNNLAEGMVEGARTENQRLGRRGKLALAKMSMRKAAPSLAGYRRVFPNYYHGGRSDGLGVPSLSPMSLGPVHHGQPGLPDAQNIENLHQGNKVFSEEVVGDTPTPAFYATRLAMYEDEKPHRHKLDPKGKKHGNAPLFSVWVERDGTERHLTYVESRQVYCHFYETLAREQPYYQKLVELLDDGYNLLLCGYDAFAINGTIEEAYLDPSHPFGHERVLYTMLAHQAEKNDLPWRKHQTLIFHS